MKTVKILTNHKKSVRSICVSEKDKMLVSAGCDNIKLYNLPNGDFRENLINSSETIFNTVAISRNNVIAAGGDNGILSFWDMESGKNFQLEDVKPQKGSLESEAGIFSVKFDYSASRLITVGCDKTIKMWKEIDENENIEEISVNNN